MSSRTYSRNAYESDLPSGVGSTGDATATSALGLTAPCYLVLSPDDPVLREYVLAETVDTGTGVLGISANRGLAGSANAPNGSTHPAGAKVRAVPVHQTLDDIFSDIETGETWETQHAPGTDPHPQYITDTEGDAKYVEVAGDTMTGPLVLPGDPTAALQAAPKQYVDAASPIGEVIMWPAAAAPAGFLLCDGAQYDGTDPDYAALFGVLGLTYGGSGTDFDVPDLRQRFPLGKAVSGTGAALGDAGGAIDHKHTNPDVDSAGGHTHADGTLAAADAGSHAHDVNITSFSSGSGGIHDHGGATGIPSGNNRGEPAGSVIGASHTHGINNESSHAHTVDPPNTASASSGTHGHDVTGDTASDGGHQHTQLNDTGIENPPFLAINFAIRYA